MKKAGAVIAALLLVFSSLSLSVVVLAQSCSEPCTNGNDCKIDQQCSSGCCAPIPCASSADCPFSCPASPNVFMPSACNTCQNGFCVDPCSCDFGATCGGSGPCLATQHLCVANNCHNCRSDCDCCRPRPGGGVCASNAQCTDPAHPSCATSGGASGKCCTGLAGSQGKAQCNPASFQCQTGASTCTACTLASQCNDGNGCTTDACIDGSCLNTANTVACDDSNACTSPDACNGQGACAAGPAVNCDDGNPCTDDSCNPVTGCVHTNNVAACNDGLFCNGADTCGGGSCSVHVGDPCPGPDGDGNCAESCNEAGDNCLANDPDSSVCNDGSACTSSDVCTSGSCAGTPIVCTDGNVCTDDSCNPVSGCVFTNNVAPCNDGLFCTVGDSCSGGLCSIFSPRDCNDNVGCTDDSCNEPGDVCDNIPNNANCDDSTCCTADVCDPQNGPPTGCTNTAIDADGDGYAVQC